MTNEDESVPLLEHCLHAPYCSLLTNQDVKNLETCCFLDYNSTTPLEQEVLEATIHAMKYYWANPSSYHFEGQLAKSALEKSRASVAKMLNANSNEIFFTSSGTESNYMVLHSIIEEFSNENNILNIIISNFEHDSVRRNLETFVKKDKISLTYIEIDPTTGQVSPNDVIAAITPETRLISIMLANNETGVIQPVEKIGSMLAAVNATRPESKVYFHSDLAQTIGKILVDVFKLHIDYGTVAGHKFYAPKAGVLYCRTGAPLIPLLLGGMQENGMRSGTENTPAIVGIGKASELVSLNIESYSSLFKKHKSYLKEKLRELFQDEIVFHYDSDSVLPNTLNAGFVDKNLKSNAVLKKCKILKASSGAACHSTVCQPSRVLMACGIATDMATRSIRFSLGRETTPDKIDRGLKELYDVVQEMKGK